MEDKHWHDVIDVNLTGSANTLRAFAPVLVKQKQGGRIILVSSTQGRHGSKDAAAYSASKWGIYGLMKTAALELGEHKITVNCVVPGLIDTPDDPQRHALDRVDEGKRSPAFQGTAARGGSDPGAVAAHPVEGAVAQAGGRGPGGGVPRFTDDAHMVSGSSYDVTAGDTAHFI